MALSPNEARFVAVKSKEKLCVEESMKAGSTSVLILLTMIFGSVLGAGAQSNQNVVRLTVSELELHNLRAETVHYKGRAAIRLVDNAAPDVANDGMAPA